jgi:hypothetical protein
MKGKFWTDFNRVSGKPLPKMPERVVLLKGFRVCGEVCGNLMIYARGEVL